MNVGTLLFDDVTVTDFTGPYDVFRAARPVGVAASDQRALFTAFTVAGPEIMRCNGGLRVLVDHSLDDHPPVEVLVVPGGFGTRREVANERLIACIDRTARAAQVATSVCTGDDALGELRLAACGCAGRAGTDECTLRGCRSPRVVGRRLGRAGHGAARRGAAARRGGRPADGPPVGV